MSEIHTSTVRAAHGYTRSRSPWILSAYGSKLIQYISGGGMTTFGRSVVQEEARRRHRKFYVWAGLLGFVWLLFYFI